MQGVWMGCLVVWLALGAGPPARAEGPPNVVLIIGDDQAWTDYGFMGHPHIRTPHLDRLAREGRTFTRGYVPSSLCSPSLATILTGLYPHQHGITSNDPPGTAGRRGPAYEVGRERMERMFDALPSLPRRLAGVGYKSMQTGKWWGGSYKTGGFTQGMSHGEMGRGGRHGDEGLRIGRETMEPVETFVAGAAREGKPFLLWYAPMMPHTPHNPPERLVAKYRGVAPSANHARYWAMCDWFDETVGQLREILERNGVLGNSLIVYLADNGWIQDPVKNGFAPRSKQSPYDGGLRTPIVLWRPGVIEPGRVEVPVSSIDLAPTILKAAGVKLNAGALPGVDLLDEEAVSDREAVFGECFTHDAVDLDEPARSLRWRWVVAGRWKLIVPNPVNEAGAPVELYDIEADPTEQTNQAEAEPEVVEQLRRKLDGWWPGRMETRQN